MAFHLPYKHVLRSICICTVHTKHEQNNIQNPSKFAYEIQLTNSICFIIVIFIIAKIVVLMSEKKMSIDFLLSFSFLFCSLNLCYGINMNVSVDMQ